MSNILIDSNSPVSKWDPKQWEIHSKRCQRDLIIKKIALALIAVLNLAGIAGLCAYLILYVPSPQTTFEITVLLTPVLIGVCSALSMLKIPTLGLNSSNYKQFLNPMTAVAKVGTLLLFGPIFLMTHFVDYKNYADPYEAKCIKKALSDHEFEKVMEEYGPRVGNLIKYGYFNQTNGEAFRSLYRAVKPLMLTNKDLVKKESVPGALSDNFAQLKNEIDLLKDKHKWEVLKADILLQLPTPEAKNPDYSSVISRFRFFCKERLTAANLQKIKLH